MRFRGNRAEGMILNYRISEKYVNIRGDNNTINHLTNPLNQSTKQFIFNDFMPRCCSLCIWSMWDKCNIAASVWLRNYCDGVKRSTILPRFIPTIKPIDWLCINAPDDGFCEVKPMKWNVVELGLWPFIAYLSHY